MRLILVTDSLLKINSDRKLSGGDVSRLEKLIKRFLGYPKDFTWEELVRLLIGLGFEEVGTGKTGGSRRRFINGTGVIITLHKPHPQNTLKRYQIEQVIEILREENLL